MLMKGRWKHLLPKQWKYKLSIWEFLYVYTLKDEIDDKNLV